MDKEIKWLVDKIHSCGGSITVRDLTRRTRKYRTAVEATEALKQVVKAGFGKWTTGNSGVGRPSRKVELNYIEGDMDVLGGLAPQPEPVVKEREEAPVEVRDLRSLERKNKRLEETLKLERAKRHEAEADYSHIHNQFEAATQAYQQRRPQRLGKTNRSHSRGEATAIICATDWHAEGKVDKDLVNGINEFNLDIAAKRIRRLWEKSIYMVDFAKSISKIQSQMLWLGGDLINGAIHEELEESNFLGPADATLWVQDQVAAGIDLLLRELPGPLLVGTNNGNHGRVTARKRISTGYLHSWEYLAYCNLARIYRNNPRVSFKIAKGYLNTVDVQGHKVRFHHGDAIRFYGGVGGITIPARKKIAQWNKQDHVAFDVFGHFHQWVDMWDMVSIGCLIGYNEYAMELACDYQPPTQGFIVVDKTYGKVLASPIFVEQQRSAA